MPTIKKAIRQALTDKKAAEVANRQIQQSAKTREEQARALQRQQFDAEIARQASLLELYTASSNIPQLLHEVTSELGGKVAKHRRYRIGGNFVNAGHQYDNGLPTSKAEEAWDGYSLQWGIKSENVDVSGKKVPWYVIVSTSYIYKRVSFFHITASISSLGTISIPGQEVITPEVWQTDPNLIQRLLVEAIAHPKEGVSYPNEPPSGPKPSGWR